jgi:hypothetical protein
VIQTLTRSDAEYALAHALSRQIGYTTGAYDLSRIFQTLLIFHDRPSAYKEEIVDSLRSSGKEEQSDSITSNYLAEVINFSYSMGLLDLVSSKESRLLRYATTEKGRSLLGASVLKNHDFYNYYSTKVVLIADCDYIFPVLKYQDHKEDIDIKDFFVRFQFEIRERRLEWLRNALPEKILFDRVARQISWLSPPRRLNAGYKVDVPSQNTARHHVVPRQGWLRHLGLCEKGASGLTQFGRAVISALEKESSYFWLAPAQSALDTLRLDGTTPLEAASEDTLNFTRAAEQPTDEEINALVDDLAMVMTEAYPYAKLVHANQASLQLPIEYVNYRAYKDDRCYSWERVLDALFSKKRSELERYSAHTGQIGFYRVKSRMNP